MATLTGTNLVNFPAATRHSAAAFQKYNATKVEHSNPLGCKNFENFQKFS